MDIGDNESREAMRYAWVGIEFAITVVAFAAGGFWLDKWLDTLPGFTVLLSVVGLATGLYNAGRDAVRFRQWLGEQHSGGEDPENNDGQRP